MPVTLNYKSSLDEIQLEFYRLGKDSRPVEDKIVKRMAEVVAVAARKNIGRDPGPRYGHKNRPHMADDVIVGNADHTGPETTRRVGGGKKTGTLWHLVEYGTIRNHFAGKHFIERTLVETDAEINKIFDDEIRKGLGVV